MLTALAWRNIWRQPQRTLLSLAAIALAGAITVFVLALQQGSYATMKENVLRILDGFAQVQPPGYADDPDVRKTIADPEALAARLTAIPGVNAAAPRGASYAIFSDTGGRSFGAGILGVDPAREAKVSTLSDTVIKGRALRPGDSDAAVIGAGLARNLGLSIGGKLTMLGAAADGSVAADVLTVVGIFSAGAPELDRQLVQIPLSRFQADFAMEGRANVIAVVGAHLRTVEAAQPAMRAAVEKDKLVVRDWAALEPGLHDAILLDMSFSVLLYVSLVAIAVFIILNTLLMSVLERTREFGMLLAIGMTNKQIGRMVWIELAILAFAGAGLGAALGAGITAWIGGISFEGAEALFAQWHMPATLYPQLDAFSIAAGPVAIALCIAIAGFVPYARMRRLQPISAMRAT